MAAAPPEPAPAPASSCSSCCSRSSPLGRSSSGRRGSPATSSSSSTPRPAWPRRTCRRTGSTEAKRLALEALRDLPAGGTVSVIAAGRTARVVVNGTTDLGRVRAAIEDIDGLVGDRRPRRRAEPRRRAGRSGGRRGHPRRHRRGARDQAADTASTTRSRSSRSAASGGTRRSSRSRSGPRSSGVTRSVFVSIANLDIEPAQRRLELYGDGILIEARDLVLDPQTRIGGDHRRRPASGPRSSRSGSTAMTGGVRDDVARARRPGVGDRAAGPAAPGPARRRRATRTSRPPCPTCRTRSCTASRPRSYGPDTHPELFDLIIFEGDLPATLPRTAILAIAPPASSDLGEVVGTLKDPGIGTPRPGRADPEVRRPLERPHRQGDEARPADLGADGHPGTGGAPLLYIGERDGQRAAVLAFLPRNSDLPLQVAFPMLMANLTGELLGGSAAPTEAVDPGRSGDASRFRPARPRWIVTRPDGSHGRARARDGRRGIGRVQPDGPARRLLGGRRSTRTPTARPAGPTPSPTVRPTGSRDLARALAPRRDPDRGADRAAGRSECSRAIRRGPVRPERERHRARARRPRSSRSAAPSLGTSPAPGASAGATPARPRPRRLRGAGCRHADERPVARDELWVADRADRPRRAHRRVARLPPRRGHAAVARPAPHRCPVPAPAGPAAEARARGGRGERTGRAGGLADGRPLRGRDLARPPDPGAAAHVHPPPRRAPADRDARGGARRSRSGRSSCRRSSSRSPGSSSCSRSIASPRSSSSTCPTASATTGREDALAFLRETLEVMPEEDQAGIVAFGKDALVERLPEELREIDRLRSTPVKAATDIGAALRLASALFPDAAQKRIVLISDGNDTTGRGQREAALAAARGIQVETRVIGLVDRDEVLVERLTTPSTARLGEEIEAIATISSSVAQPATVRLYADGTLVATERVDLKAGANRVVFRVKPTRAGVPHLPRRRRGRRRHVQPERPRRLEHDRQGRAADPRARRGPDGRRGARHRAEGRGPERRFDHPRGAPDRLRRPRDYDSIVVVDVPRLRLTDQQLATLQIYVRDLGPRARHGRRAAALRRRRLHEDADGGDAPGRHGRAQPAEGAGHRARRRHRQVRLDGRLPLQHVQRRRAVAAQLAGRAQGRHRQGGDPPRRGRAHGARRARCRRVRRIGALGRPDEAARPASATSRATIAGIDPLGHDEHLRGAGPGGRVAREGDRDPPPHHPADRRLVLLRSVRRDHRPDEGGRDHPLDRRRGRRREPVPRAAREAGRRPVLRGREPGLDPRHLPQGDAAGRRPADHRGDVLPDPDEQLADPARPRAGLPAAARLQRDDDQVGCPARARLAARRSRSSPSGSTGSAGPSRGRPTRPGRWAKNWIGWPGFTKFFSQLVGWTFPGEETGGIEAAFETLGGQTRLHVESVESDGSPRDFYRTMAVVVGPDLVPGRGRSWTRSRRASTRRTSARSSPAPTRSGSARRDRARAALGRTVGLVEPVAAEYRLLGVEPAVPGGAAVGDRRPRDPAPDRPVDPRPPRSPRRSPSCGRGC